MRRVLAAGAVLVAVSVVAGAALAAAPPTPPGIQTHPGLPFHPSGSVVGEGLPLKAYANIEPTVHLFGDTIHARLSVVADTRWVDPTRLSVKATFAPYTAVAGPQLLRLHVGRFEQMTWTWTLRCLAARCVPVVPPSEKFHVFHFPSAHIVYLKPNGKPSFGIAATWPRVEVLSQVSPGVVSGLALKKKYDWQYGLAPVLSPTFRIRPALLFWLAIGAAGFAGLLALFALLRWYHAIRPRRAGVAAFRGTPLERALSLLAWAHEHGDETLQRKAFERVADELGVAPERDDLSRAAHELAWQPRLPADDEVAAFTRQAREREPEEEEQT
jgi:hypothetical protein